MKMKLMTLNTHSIVEPDYENKLETFAKMIKIEKPDVFALQEVNQSVAKPELTVFVENGYVPCKDLRPVIRMDNHALRLDRFLRSLGMEYYWTWIPLKIGYDIYEEGLAIFSRTPITEIRQFYISKSHTMSNWKTRKVLSIKTNNMWFHNIHMGWWDDAEDPFKAQWDMTCSKLSGVMKAAEYHFMMGDFNSPSGIRGEGYDYVKASGWFDTWMLAQKKDDGITVGKVIDGWRERMDETEALKGVRLDYIWVNKELKVKSSKVICNTQNYPAVSDHYGVMIEVED